MPKATPAAAGVPPLEPTPYGADSLTMPLVGLAVEALDRIAGAERVTVDTLKAIDARIDDRVYAILTVDASVASRRSHGGTAPVQVRARIAQAKQELGL